MSEIKLTNFYSIIFFKTFYLQICKLLLSRRIKNKLEMFFIFQFQKGYEKSKSLLGRLL